jgi:hypothetical protein
MGQGYRSQKNPAVEKVKDALGEKIGNNKTNTGN